MPSALPRPTLKRSISARSPAKMNVPPPTATLREKSNLEEKKKPTNAKKMATTMSAAEFKVARVTSVAKKEEISVKPAVSKIVKPNTVTKAPATVKKTAAPALKIAPRTVERAASTVFTTPSTTSQNVSPQTPLQAAPHSPLSKKPRVSLTKTATESILKAQKRRSSIGNRRSSVYQSSPPDSEWEKKFLNELENGGTGGIGVSKNSKMHSPNEKENERPRNPWSPIRKSRGMTFEESVISCTKKSTQ
ncbi:hypothetical protein PROFUN_06635 [Planoprotostelium fungivorum]|uniref:Uncharacterized protein n=1 Tax=Planoprotostelium fungivorum TaxID=1890364 RepID=A0A2P6MSV2_9EUKA|nr:hypothetical protein PROFUN_06635 [Planoprotostelium fungivorum]